MSLDGHVQSGDGLVGDEQLRVHDDGPGDADTLPLAAGELMGVPARMLPDQAHQLQHLIDLLVDVGLVLDAVDDQALGDDLSDRHTGVQRGHRVLIDHLDPGDELGVLGHPQGVLVLLFQLGTILGGAVLQLLLVLGLGLLHQLLGVFLVGILVVELGPLDLLLVVGDDLVELSKTGRIRAALLLLPGFLDGVLVGLDAGADALALEVDVAGGDVIDLDDGTAGGGLAAAGLAHKAEDLALVDVEAHVVHGLGRSEVLAEILYFQQHFSIISHFRYLPPVSRSCGGYGR